MRVREVQFVSPGTAELREIELGHPGAGEVQVAMELTAISLGTERDWLLGRNNTSRDFPMTLGYSGYGRIIDVGAGVDGLAVGDRVTTMWSRHADRCNLNAAQVLKVGDGTSDRDAALAFIASFGLGAVRKTSLELGQGALVAGLGILGLFAARLATAAGAIPVIGSDTNGERREFALRSNSVDVVLDPASDDFDERVRELVPGGVPVGIDASGAPQALEQILGVSARFAKVALLGCTRDVGPGLDFYRLVHVPGITVVGAHTSARRSDDSSAGWWSERDDTRAVLSLIDANRLSLADAVTDVYVPQDAVQVYSEIASGKAAPAVALFDWTGGRR